MMTRYLIFGLLTFFLMFFVGTSLKSCEETSAGHHYVGHEDQSLATAKDTLNAKKDSLHIESDYDLETVDPKHREEFLENMAKIEKEYGQQWDFCTCIVKNDSVQNAIMDESLTDAQFDALFNRSEFIDGKCQAFLVQSLSQTPEERFEHKKKVDACLKEAGLK